MGNLWIGPPGAMTEIDQAAKSFDRSADLGVAEFKSLGGRVTLTHNLAPVRRIKLSWDLLAPQHARALDRIARRIDGDGPVLLVDPAAKNVLGAAQSAGRGSVALPGPQAWFTGSANGSVTEYAGAVGTFGFVAADATSYLAWRWTTAYGNFPVAPGLAVSFRAPTAFAGLGTTSVGLDFKRADGSYIDGVGATGPLVSGTAPAGAVAVTPTAKPGVVGTFSLAGACLTLGGEPAADDVPGDGYPAMSVTGYSDAPGRPLPYRSIGIDLVEVSGAAG